MFAENKRIDEVKLILKYYSLRSVYAWMLYVRQFRVRVFVCVGVSVSAFHRFGPPTTFHMCVCVRA